MLNRTVLMGRITRDLELRQTPSGVSTVSFTLAVDRSYVKQGEERQADFISCVAWRQTAEFITKYFRKGSLIALEGQLRSRVYDDNNGVKHYVTEVFVDNVSFTGEKSERKQEQSYGAEYEYHRPEPAVHEAAPSSGRTDYSDGVLSDDGVPF